MADKDMIKEEQIEQANGGSGYAVPDSTGNCPRCNSENVMFDKSQYLPAKGQMIYYFYCRDCGHRFQKS